jgi:hypothetical protein
VKGWRAATPRLSGRWVRGKGRFSIVSPRVRFSSRVVAPGWMVFWRVGGWCIEWSYVTRATPGGCALRLLPWHRARGSPGTARPLPPARRLLVRWLPLGAAAQDLIVVGGAARPAAATPDPELAVPLELLDRSPHGALAYPRSLRDLPT